MSGSRLSRRPRSQRPFPIPMRGNELVRRLSSLSETSWFPIPMKGNECAKARPISTGLAARNPSARFGATLTAYP